VVHVQTTPERYYQWAVSEYGSSKGIEVDVIKSLSDYFAFNFSYSLAWVTNTSTDEASNTVVYQDPYSGIQTFPLAPYPANTDIRHRFKGGLTLQSLKNQGPTFHKWKPLQNMYIHLEPTIVSGTPYTKRSVEGSIEVSGKNEYRTWALWFMNAKVQKSFALKDWFGESMGNRARIDFYVDVMNVFNRRGPQYPYTTTGSPLDDYHMNLRPLGMFNNTPW
jgi:hypothetical protein